MVGKIFFTTVIDRWQQQLINIQYTCIWQPVAAQTSLHITHSSHTDERSDIKLGVKPNWIAMHDISLWNNFTHTVKPV